MSNLRGSRGSQPDLYVAVRFGEESVRLTAVKPPIPYHGGKSRSAAAIASLLPDGHKCYVEPFAGSAAVLFAKNPSKVEIINDADRGLWAFFTALRDCRDDLIEACTRTPYSRHEFAICRSAVDDEELPLVERARRFWVVITQSYGSVPNSTGWSSPETTLPETAKIRRLIQRFDEVAARLSEVHVECDTAERVLDRYDSPNTVHFVDPPYLWSTRAWAPRQKRKLDYRVELQTDDEHSALLQQVRLLEGRVLLCGRRSDLYERELSDWRQIELNNRGRDVLWLNF